MILLNSILNPISIQAPIILCSLWWWSPSRRARPITMDPFGGRSATWSNDLLACGLGGAQITYYDREWLCYSFRLLFRSNIIHGNNRIELRARIPVISFRSQHTRRGVENASQRAAIKAKEEQNMRSDSLGLLCFDWIHHRPCTLTFVHLYAVSCKILLIKSLCSFWSQVRPTTQVWI